MVAAGIIGIFIGFGEAGITLFTIDNIDEFTEVIAEDGAIILAALEERLFATFRAFVFDGRDASFHLIAAETAIFRGAFIGVGFAIRCRGAGDGDSVIVGIIAVRRWNVLTFDGIAEFFAWLGCGAAGNAFGGKFVADFGCIACGALEAAIFAGDDLIAIACLCKVRAITSLFFRNLGAACSFHAFA